MALHSWGGFSGICNVNGIYFQNKKVWPNVIEPAGDIVFISTRPAYYFYDIYDRIVLDFREFIEKQTAPETYCTTLTYNRFINTVYCWFAYSYEQKKWLMKAEYRATKKIPPAFFENDWELKMPCIVAEDNMIATFMITPENSPSRTKLRLKRN